MQSDNRFFDDLARMANGAMGAMAGMRGELETLFRQRMERFIADLDLVQRDDFEAVRVMAARARDLQEDFAIRLGSLESRLAALEARVAGTPAAAAPPSGSSEAGQDTADATVLKQDSPNDK